MSIQSSRSLLAGSLVVLITASASACQQVIPPNALSSGALNKAPDGSMRFVADGRRMVPARLQGAQAELLYENRIGEFMLPRLGPNELLVIFRDNRRQVDMVYRMNSGRGELVCIFNDNHQVPETTTERQLVIDISDGSLRSMDIYRRDLGDELFSAFASRDLTMMSKLLNSNPSLSNVPISRGMTLLMLADDLRVAKMAIDAGANVSAKDINGNTALHYAAYHGTNDIAELLIAHKADMDARNVFGYTPLHFAVLGRHKALANYLIRHGANSNIRNGLGQTPLGIALENNN